MIEERDGKTFWFADIDNGITTDGKKFFCERCNDKELTITCIKAHAVEVLAERLNHIVQLERIHSTYAYWKDIREVTRNDYRAEARALLGWEE